MKAPSFARVMGTVALILGAFEGSVLMAQPEHEHAFPGSRRSPWSGEGPLRLVKVWTEPQDFKGVMTYDRERDRLFLVSFGPPENTRGPSEILEMDREDRRVLRRAVLPFEGVLSSGVCIGDVLYIGVFHDSKIYRIDVSPGPDFGKLLGEIDLPTLNDIEYDRSRHVFRFPFIVFRGLTKTADDKLLMHAQDLGDLIVIDPETGKFLQRTSTVRGLADMAGTAGAEERSWIIANMDPAQASFEWEVRQFMFRSAHGLLPSVKYGRQDLVWLLVDATTGEVLASLEDRGSPVRATSLALLGHEEAGHAPFGRFTLLVSGEDGLLEIEWTPGIS